MDGAIVCFWQLANNWGGQLSGLQLRQLAVEFLTQHTRDFEKELISLGWDKMETNEIPVPLEGDMLLDAVIQTLSNPHTRGGAECLAAISLALNKQIRVYQEDGPTFVFPGDESQTIRVLLRYPRGGTNRKTHYQSVLKWRVRAPAPVAGTSRDAATQTNGLSSSTEVQDTVETSRQCGEPNSATMVLRPRQDPVSADSLRPMNFSDTEEFEETNDPNVTRFSRCIICKRNVGRYALIGCGDFPCCGCCIKQWYVEIEGVPCPICKKRVSGWTKVFNQK